MSDDIGGTPKAIAQAYDGDQNRIAIYNGPNLKLPARGLVPYDPRPDQVTLDSIVHATGLTCRFSGHVRYFYSVAQHLLYVAAHVPPEQRLRALLHDASEAYLTDIPSPYKMQIPGYKATEAKVQHAIGLHFGIDDLEVKTPEVKAADYRALGHEANSFMPTEGDWYGPYYRQAIADTAHLKPIMTFNSAMLGSAAYGYQVSEIMRLAESMRVAAYAIEDLRTAIQFEVAMREYDYDTVGQLARKAEAIYKKYRYE